jgi:hypothetical protein
MDPGNGARTTASPGGHTDAPPADTIDAYVALKQPLKGLSYGEDLLLQGRRTQQPARTLADLVCGHAIELERQLLSQFYRSDRLARQLYVMMMEDTQDSSHRLSPEREQEIHEALEGAFEHDAATRLEQYDDAADTLEAERMLSNAELGTAEDLASATERYNMTAKRVDFEAVQQQLDPSIEFHGTLRPGGVFERFCEAAVDEDALRVVAELEAGQSYLELARRARRSTSLMVRQMLAFSDRLDGGNSAQQYEAAERQCFEASQPERNVLARAGHFLQRQGYSLESPPSLVQTHQALRQAYRDEFGTAEAFMAYQHALSDLGLRTQIEIYPRIMDRSVIFKAAAEGMRSRAGIVRAHAERRRAFAEQRAREYFS